MALARVAFVVSFLAASAFIDGCHGATAEEWKSRTIFQVLTDRFAKTTDDYNSCGNLGDYCGGTFQGIINHLDYIQNLGADAIWISPIVVNSAGGYHGYWQTNMYGINPYFGTAQDLLNLTAALHARGMYLMVDVVANHVSGAVDISQINPFNSSEHYHDCNGCSGCNIASYTCFTEQMQNCRVSGLLDLNQTVPYVKEALNSWISDLVITYGIDGLRIDTIPEVSVDFWPGFVQAANTFAIGEAFSDLNCCATYANSGVPGVMSYPLFFTLQNVFARQQSLNALQSLTQSYSAFHDQTTLGVFTDNHDNPRFLSINGDHVLYKNALTYSIYSLGIPIVYYGSEQGFSGGSDPNCREVLWPTQYNQQSDLYLFIQTLLTYRKKLTVWDQPQVQRYSDDNFYAFTRGTTFVATTNVGVNGGTVTRTITYHPYASGARLCNIFYPTTDCLTVSNNQFTVALLHGESKVYFLSA